MAEVLNRITEGIGIRQFLTFIRFRDYNIYDSIHPENAARGIRAISVKGNIYHSKTESIQAATVNIKTKYYIIYLFYLA